MPRTLRTRQLHRQFLHWYRKLVLPPIYEFQWWIDENKDSRDTFRPVVISWNRRKNTFRRNNWRKIFQVDFFVRFYSFCFFFQSTFAIAIEFWAYVWRGFRPVRIFRKININRDVDPTLRKQCKVISNSCNIVIFTLECLSSRTTSVNSPIDT